MSTSTLRERLHSYLEVAHDKKIKAIYTMVEHDIITSDLLFTETIKNDLDKRYADYKTGRVKMISAPESKRRIQKILRGNSTA